jgi:acyl-CoA reductase-like NAD-dependent aldehyde dehydrogenase
MNPNHSVKEALIKQKEKDFINYSSIDPRSIHQIMASSSSSSTKSSVSSDAVPPAPLLNVEELQARMFDTHKSGINRSYEWRRTQLQTLSKMIVERQEIFREALCFDLGRHKTEAIVDILPALTETQYMLDHLKGWMEPQHVPIPAILFPASARIERKPLHAPGVLIIGPSNYPLQMCLRPLAGVLAGGNPCVIKPSELTPHTGMALANAIAEYFDPAVVQVVLGGIPETTALLSKHWSKVMFTGSERVGKIVAQSCATTLTPCILELGGKSVVIVDETVPSKHVQNVADRIIFAKYFNAGQICVAPDTILIHESHLPKLLDALLQALEKQFGKDPKLGELTRIVNQQNAQRLLEMIQEVEQHISSSPAPPDRDGPQSDNTKHTRIVIGGSGGCDVSNRFIAPTIVVHPPTDCRLMTDEIFGPILPIVSFSTMEEAIRLTQTLGSTTGIPLFLYIFTPDAKIGQQYMNVCPSGGAVINDMVVQLANTAQPLGGIGTSGYGAYFGKFSFDAFTHPFPITIRPLGSIWDFNNLRCHPYSNVGNGSSSSSSGSSISRSSSSSSSLSWKAVLLEKVAFKLPMIPPAISTPRGMMIFTVTSMMIIPILVVATTVAVTGGATTTSEVEGTSSLSAQGCFRLWLASTLESGATYLRDMR